MDRRRRRCGKMQEDAGKFGTVREDAGKFGEIRDGAGRCREIRKDAGFGMGQRQDETLDNTWLRGGVRRGMGFYTETWDETQDGILYREKGMRRGLKHRMTRGLK